MNSVIEIAKSILKQSANPNKSVGNWLRKNPRPYSPPTPARQKQIDDFGERMQWLADKKTEFEKHKINNEWSLWSEKEKYDYLNNGIKP